MLLNEAPGKDNNVADLLRQRNNSQTLDRPLRKINPDNMHITALAADSPLQTRAPFPAAPHPDQQLIDKYLRETTTPTTTAAVGEEALPHQETRDLSQLTAEGKRKSHTQREPTLHRDKARKKPQSHATANTLIRNEAPSAPPRPAHTVCNCLSHTFKRDEAKRIFNTSVKQRSEGERAANVIQQMFGYTQHVEAISGWRMVTQPGKRDPHKKEKVTQIQYLVHWVPSIIPEWALDYHKQAGYTAANSTHCSRKEMAHGKQLTV
jgi:hypothetical protein